MKEQITNHDVLQAVNQWATTMESRMDRMESQMATKQDLANVRLELHGDIRRSEHRIRDHVDAKLADLRGAVRSNTQRIDTLESLHSL